MQKKFKISLVSLSVFIGLLYPSFALAFCPVCTVAVGAGVGLTRYLGVDDTISGLWIGGLTVAIAIWTIEWLQKKKIKFALMEYAVPVLYYIFIVLPLYWMGVIGHVSNTMWGVDKLLLGIISGSIFFFLGGYTYFHIKKIRGKAHFPYQKVVMAVAPLVVLTVIFYFLTK